MSEIVTTKPLSLPLLSNTEANFLDQLTEAMGVPRAVIASNEQIQDAWSGLPNTLGKIPEEYRGALLARMCIAIRTGLFDSAINYAWNVAILNIRQKMEDFDLSAASELLESDLTEGKLVKITDSDLLKHALELNLISEDGYYFLSQCRDIRNNFSAAHPVIGEEVIDEYELLNFINRCAKYAFETGQKLKGINVKKFITVLKKAKFDKEQLEHWVEKIKQTNENQRNFIYTALHGIYCDESSSEETRLNAIKLSKHKDSKFTPKTLSNIVNQHQDYLAKGSSKKLSASRLFFEKLRILKLLDEKERHSVISRAAERLMTVHQEFNNFYNEPPFAERLLEIAKSGAIPDISKHGFVEVVVTCAVGNPYGTCDAALIYYYKIIRGFKQAEIKIMLELPDTDSIFANRLKNNARCRKEFKKVAKMVSKDSVPASLKGVYKKIIA